jgi:hypothetical protein
MKIIKTLLLTAAVAAFLCQASAAGEYDMTDVNMQIKVITDKKLNVFISEIEVQNLLDSSEFQALRTKCNTDWAQILEHLDLVEGGDEAKKLIVAGLGDLSAQNYMTAVESIVTKYENGGTSDKVIESLLYPLGRMRAFMRDNYQHPRVVAVLNKIKSKTTIAALKGDIDRLLDGTAKERLEDFRDAHDGMSEGDIPKVILPP